MRPGGRIRGLHPRSDPALQPPGPSGTPRPPAPPEAASAESAGRPVARRLASLVLAAGIVAAVAAFYASRERVFHAWDFRAHHHFAQELVLRLREDPAAGLGHVARSIRHDVYNRLPALVVAPMLLVAGTSRAAYLAATAIAFLLPAVVASASLARSVARAATDDRALLAALALPAIGSAPLWATSLRGFPDAGGAALLAVAAAVWVRGDPAGGRPTRWVTIGTLLAAAYLLRRTWAPPIVAFAATAAILDGLRAVAAPPRLRRLAVSARDSAGGIAVSVALVALCTWPILRTYLTVDLPAQFAGYRYGKGFLERLLWIPDQLGLLSVAATLGGLGWGLTRPACRRAAALLLGSAVLVAVLGARIQVLGLQHFCWFAPAIATGFALGVRALGGRSPGRRAGLASIALLPALYAVAPLPRHPVADLWLGRLQGRPEVRADYDALRRLGGDLHAGLGERGMVYVACSSETFNSDLLRSLLDVVEPGAAARVLPTSDVDFRAAPPAVLFRAHLVVVCEPVQYHLPPENQRSVAAAAEPFLSGQGIAAHYRRLPRAWALRDGVRVLVFRRQTVVPEAERLRFLERFPRQR